jgi:hypothetical protein
MVTILSLALSVWLSAQPSFALERTRRIQIAENKNSDASLALQLYNQKAYGPATDAFERLIRTSTPEPNLYYYAALANQGSLQEARAKQLFQYIVTNFPQTLWARYAKLALASQPSQASSAGSSANSMPVSKDSAISELPDAVRAKLPKEMQDMLHTPAGQQAVKEAMLQNSGKVQSIQRGVPPPAGGGSEASVSVTTVCDNKAPNQIRILFIGNSFTSTYELPGMFANLCGNTAKLKISEVICCEASRVTAGGFTLEDHWHSGQAMDTIRNGGPWDYVVLQESSIRPISEPSFSLDYIARFDREIRNHGAKTVLYETWANQKEQGKQDLLNQTYRTAANDSRAILVPAGEAWHALTENHPEINLYGPDTHHPSEEGVYLTACVFYAKLFHKKPEDLHTSAGHIESTTAVILQKQAWETAASSP